MCSHLSQLDMLESGKNSENLIRPTEKGICRFCLYVKFDIEGAPKKRAFGGSFLKIYATNSNETYTIL